MKREHPVILVVDDNPTNLDVLFEIFAETEFEVSFVTDGKSCLELANSDHPDLILLDIMMPGLDGFEVCLRLKANEATTDIPVIFMTARSETADKVKGFNLGAIDYITKPIQPKEVLARVNTHLTIQRLQKDLRLKNEALLASLEREKQLNQELQASLERERELNHLKSRFISIASHEIRSPLGLIGITTNMLKRYFDRMPEEKRNEHLNAIEHEVGHMADILNNVLVLTKAEAKNFQFHPVCLNVSMFCQGIVERFSTMSEATHSITFSTTDEYIEMNVDPKLLEPVFSNLLSNAIKYSPAGGPIRVELIRQNKDVLFKVHDKGIGISEEDQQHLFEAFYRGENVNKIQGSGLGLLIVKQFVELHGGTISVESKADQGTTFTVQLPFRD
jgi:signal transduction histidine kinase